GADVFVTKINSAGTAQYFSTVFGGRFADVDAALAVDDLSGSTGNIYVSGTTLSADLPTTPGSYEPVSRIGSSPSVPLLNVGEGFSFKTATNGVIVSASYFGGSTFQNIFSVGVTAAGEAVLGGVTSSADFPVTSGAIKSTLGGRTAFLTRMNAAGNNV